MKQLRKQRVAFIAALSLGALFANNSQAQSSDLFISEYVEGSSSNKYIEIYNGTGSTVNLSNYQLRLYSNGSATPSITNTLSGTLSTGATVVYRNSSATAYLGSAISLTSINFNGDDAIELYNTATSSSVDIFGVIGCDPGAQWIISGNETKDMTLRRNGSVTSGIATNPSCTSSTSDFTSLGTEWEAYQTDDVSDLGQHSLIPSASVCPTALFFSEYMEGSGDNKCLEIINKTGASVDLAAGNYKVKIYFNGNISAATIIPLTGTVANGDVFVLCDDNAISSLLAKADQTSTSNFFNGNDAVELVAGTTSLDIIGEIGSDPGTAWTSNSFTLTTTSRTLVRKSNVVQGTTANLAGFPTLGTEWIAYPADFEDSLGQHLVNCDTTSPPSNPDFLKITNLQANEVGFLVDGKSASGNYNDLQYIAPSSTSLVQVLPFTNSPVGSVGEVIAFTQNSPVIVQTAVNWTFDSDTIPVPVDTAKMQVPITIWIVYAPNNDFLAQKQKALQDLMTTQLNFDKERLGVEFSNVTVIDATNDPDAANYYNFTCGMRAGLETDIGNAANQINVYYLQTVDGSTTRGQSCTVGSNFSALGSNAGVELQSHEIGHNFFLFHIDALVAFGFNQTNIMHSASNTREFLTEGQTFRAHTAPQSSINDTYNARPGEVTRSCAPTSTITGDYGCPAIQTRIWTDQ